MQREQRTRRLVQILDDIRVRRGWSMRRLAIEADVSLTGLVNWRAGRVQPTLDVLERCFEVLGVELVPLPRVEPMAHVSAALRRAQPCQP